MEENNLQKKPRDSKEYANLFLLDENGKKRDFSNVNSVCLVTIGHAETLWILLQGFVGKDVTIIDRKSEIDFIEALKKLHNRDDIKIVQKIEVETEKVVLNTILNLNMSFDLIIANPPFSVASKITQATVELAKQSVYLMPFGKYKKYELFQYVSSTQSVDESCFVDAAQDIQPNLMICKLQNTRDESKKLIDMEKFVWNTDFATFYEKNEKIPATFQSFVYNNKDRGFVEKNLERIFFIPYWPHVGNAQKEKSVTRKANLGEKESLERILKSNASYSYFLFGSKLEKENAFRFWVSDLCNKLILGCLTRSLIFKFPHVDWSHPYTDSEILKELELPEDFLEEK